MTTADETHFRAPTGNRKLTGLCEGLHWQVAAKDDCGPITGLLARKR